MAVTLGEAPAWFAAAGTVGAFTAALWQIGNEQRERRSAAKRMRIERHLEQARLIAAYMGEEEKPTEAMATSGTDTGRTAFFVTNNSPEPVYSVVVGLVFIQGAGPRTLESVLELNREQYGRLGPVAIANILPEGLYRLWVTGTGWHRILSGRPGLDVAFTDKAEAHWIRRADGKLEELPVPPLEHLRKHGLEGPYDFQVPKRVLPQESAMI